MPVHNAVTTIRIAVESVLSQSITDIELLVGDDASTDETRAVLSSISDSRIQVSRNQGNLGPGATRDLLLSKATGHWITFCDADDLWESTRLAELLESVKDDEHLVAFDDIMECHATRTGIVPWKRVRGPRAFGAETSPVRVEIADWIDSPRMLMQPFFSRSQLLRSRARHSGYPFGEDTYFLLKLLTPDGILMYVPKAMYLYRLTPGSATTNTQRSKYLREILESALPDYADRPKIQEALHRKIERVRHDEKYLPFIHALKRMKFGEALAILKHHPGFLLEFLRRSLHSIPYHVSRLYHGGNSRSAA